MDAARAVRAPRLNGCCGVGQFFCAAMRCRDVSVLLATRPRRHHIFRLASRAHATRCGLHFSLTTHGDGDWFGPDDRAAHGVEKLFQKSLKVLLTGSRHRPILPPHTTDIRPRATTQEAWKPQQFCPFAKLQLFLLFAVRSSDRKSISHHHTHKEHVSGSILAARRRFR